MAAGPAGPPHLVNVQYNQTGRIFNVEIGEEAVWGVHIRGYLKNDHPHDFASMLDKINIDNIRNARITLGTALGHGGGNYYHTITEGNARQHFVNDGLIPGTPRCPCQVLTPGALVNTPAMTRSGRVAKFMYDMKTPTSSKLCCTGISQRPNGDDRTHPMFDERDGVLNNNFKDAEWWGPFNKDIYTPVPPAAAAAGANFAGANTQNIAKGLLIASILTMIKDGDANNMKSVFATPIND